MKQGSSILKMAAIKIIEKSDEQSLVKEDLMSYMKGSKAKQLLSELWPHIKLDSDGRILYIGDEVGELIPGSPLVDLIEYTVADDRSSLERPLDIEKFWTILAANDLTNRVEEGDNKWIKLV